jgi:serine/threonine-protein kinase
VLERDVALKEISTAGIADGAAVQRFRREAQALARLTHSNIVQVYDLVESAERLWMVMELVEGESLASILEREGRLPAEEAARIGLQVARGLSFAHRRGVIHRDVKPSNVLVTRDGTAKVADFGVARMTDTGTGTLPGQVIGSPHYLSPEQASGREADERSDVYSMGVMMFEMLSGRRPFEGDLMSLLSQHLTQPPPPIGGNAASDDLETVVRRMLEKQPSNRPADMDETGRLLGSFCGAGHHG